MSIFTGRFGKAVAAGIQGARDSWKGVIAYSLEPVWPEPADVIGSLFNDHSLFDSEDLIAENFEHAVEDVRHFLKANNFSCASAAFELLLEKKEGLFRADKKTPGAVHEIQQISMIYGFIKSGLIPKNFHDDLQGPLELLFIAPLLHDIGEDFNVYREDLVKDLETRVGDLKNDFTPYDQGLIERAADVMELMTHERKYRDTRREKAEDTIRGVFLLDENAQLPDVEDFIEDDIPNHHKAIRVPELEDKVRTKMHDVKDGTDDLQVYATLEKKRRGKPPQVMYVITRYGMGNNIGTDWNRYVNAMQSDLAAIFSKYIDRINGLSTRIGVDRFNLQSNFDYLRRTEDLFGLQNTTEEMKEEYPLFSMAFDAADSMMGCLFKINQMYHNSLGASNPEGCKGFDAGAIKPTFNQRVKDSHQRVAALNFKKYFASRLPKLEHTPLGFTPVFMVMDRLKASIRLHPEIKNVYEVVKDTLLQETRNRGFKVFPKILNRFDDAIPS